MSVIVTGANGFVGRRLYELWGNPADLIGIDLNPSYRQYYSLDLCNFEAVISILQEVHPSLIIHLAAFSHVLRPDVHLKQSPHEMLGKNVLATYNVLQAVNYYPFPCHVILAGSAAEYGNTVDDQTPQEDEICFPLEPYGISKHICSLLAKQMPFAKTLRFANIYGPGQKDKFIPTLIDTALTGRQLILHGKGRQTRQWLYVDDAIEAIKLAAVRLARTDDIFNITPKEEVSIRDLTTIIYQALQDKALELHWDLPIMDLVLQEGGGGSQRVVMDGTRANTQLGWCPKMSLEQGIRKTVETIMLERFSKYETSAVGQDTRRSYPTTRYLP